MTLTFSVAHRVLLYVTHYTWFFMEAGSKTMILARAPFRIPLGGGGTDLPSYYGEHGGFVLSAAMNRYVYIYVNRPAADDLIRVKYSSYEQVERAEQVRHDLVRPALQLLKINNRIEIVSMADVPDGTGLGSSSSYLVALLTALHALKGEKVPTLELAERACHIEMNMAGHPVGKHDHYLAAFGGITVLEIDKSGRVEVRPAALSITTMEELRNGTLLFYTGLRRSSTTILQEQNDGTRQRNRNMLDSLHRTKELGYRIREALETGDLDAFGRLLHEHWENKKRRSGNITDPAMDAWYELARENGAMGGKIMGAGGGGFFMFFCRNGKKDTLRKAMSRAGLRELHYDFDLEGAKVLVNI